MPQDPSEQLNRLTDRWNRLFGDPLWYLSVAPELKALRAQIEAAPTEVRDRCKAALYDFFEKRLLAGVIAFGNQTDADAERKSIDTVVFHHTSNPPGLRPSRLSAIELIRLYVPYFATPTHPEDAHWNGLPIASGHERGGRQVFWPYHWIIRQDGTAERLLDDAEIGWHAGDWDMNCQSVGIVFDNDLEWIEPSAIALDGAADLIAEHYAKIPLRRILGHREVIAKTECPSRHFLPGASGAGWKQKLLTRVAQAEGLAVHRLP